MRKTLPWLFAVGLIVWAGAARASHYAVADVPRLITPAQVEKLHKGKVETTEELLNKGATSKDRKALGKATGLKGPELLVLVHRCDLLRIKSLPRSHRSPTGSDRPRNCLKWWRTNSAPPHTPASVCPQILLESSTTHGPRT